MQGTILENPTPLTTAQPTDPAPFQADARRMLMNWVVWPMITPIDLAHFLSATHADYCEGAGVAADGEDGQRLAGLLRDVALQAICGKREQLGISVEVLGQVMLKAFETGANLASQAGQEALSVSGTVIAASLRAEVSPQPDPVPLPA